MTVGIGSGMWNSWSLTQVAHQVSLSLLIVDALQFPDSGPTTNAHILPTTSWEIGNAWAALYFTARVPSE